AMAMFGALAFVPLFVQSVTGASATRSGAVLVPFVLGWVALSALSARLVLRVGYRGGVMTGVACLTSSFLLLARWDAELGLAAAHALADALHGVFVTGLVVCGGALASSMLVPAGRAQDLARAEMRGEPTLAGG